MSPLKVIIIGAGSSGLLLAQGLTQHGIDNEVYEKEYATVYQTRPREWGMTLHWGAEYISRCLPPELRENFDASIACDPYYTGKDHSMPIFDAAKGGKLLDMHGVEPKRISRRKLRQHLSQGLKIHNGKKAIAMETTPDGSMNAMFADGTNAQGSLLVGCDSARSVVRKLLVGEDAAKLEDMGLRMMNVACSFPRETALLQRKAHPIFKNAFAKIDGVSYAWWQSIQDVQDPDRPETWLFQNILSWPGDPSPDDLPDRASRLQFWREKGKHLADPWKSVARDLPDDLYIVVDEVTSWKPIEWSESPFSGRATLAGDACHPVPPWRGQGLNLASADASDLVDELLAVDKGEKSLKDALTAYESGMRARALTEIPLSVAQATMVHDFDNLMQAPFVKHGMHVYRAEQEAKGE